MLEAARTRGDTSAEARLGDPQLLLAAMDAMDAYARALDVWGAALLLEGSL